MSRLRFRYYMCLAFDTPIHDHRFTLKCIPQTSERQTIESLEIDVYPNRFISRDTDSFGNGVLYGYSDEEHERFFFDIKGIARISPKEYETAAQTHKLGMFRYQTDYTRPGSELLRYGEKLRGGLKGSHADKALYIMQNLYQDYHYKSGITSIHTRAEEAWQLGEGVCQDYAHIMLSLCRMECIPCRYVTGMLLGEGASHAWVEVESGGRWVGYDPTNNQTVMEQHIRISGGRDYQDCIINQGVFVGNAHQSQSLKVTVEELGESEEV